MAQRRQRIRSKKAASCTQQQAPEYTRVIKRRRGGQSENELFALSPQGRRQRPKRGGHVALASARRIEHGPAAVNPEAVEFRVDAPHRERRRRKVKVHDLARDASLARTRHGGDAGRRRVGERIQHLQRPPSEGRSVKQSKGTMHTPTDAPRRHRCRQATHAPLESRDKTLGPAPVSDLRVDRHGSELAPRAHSQAGRLILDPHSHHNRRRGHFLAPEWLACSLLLPSPRPTV